MQSFRKTHLSNQVLLLGLASLAATACSSVDLATIHSVVADRHASYAVLSGAAAPEPLFPERDAVLLNSSDAGALLAYQDASAQQPDDAGRSGSVACEATQEFDYQSGQCLALPLGAQLGDACGPGGEGALPFAECDVNRGLVCAQPPPGLLDAPPSCICPAGQFFSVEWRACRGDTLGARPGDPCGPGGEGSVPWAACDEQRGLKCLQLEPELLDAPPICKCDEGTVWSNQSYRCAGTEDCRDPEGG